MKRFEKFFRCVAKELLEFARNEASNFWEEI